MDNNQYTVIIGDIIKSKEIKDRNKVQNNLKQTLNKVNELYGEDGIASQFIITLGDEFQGLLVKPDISIEVIRLIEQEMYPIKIRFGIGIGSISTNINRFKSNEVDGSAYHRARKMIDRIENVSNRSKTNIMVLSDDEETEIDQLINSNLSLIFAIKEDWSKRQFEYVVAYRNNKESQEKIAEQMNVTQSSVSKSLKLSKYYVIEQVEHTIKEVLKKGDVI